MPADGSGDSGHRPGVEINRAAAVYPWLQSAWEAFTDRILANRMPHALLVHGPEGIGKSALARDMAGLLLCQSPGEGRACGACRSCELMASGAHPDWFRLSPEEGKHQILVEGVRSTIRSLSLTTTISERKLALLEPAEAMNRSAANALLKSLEEPPGDAVLILVAHDPSRLPVTIRSRCQAIGLAMPNRDAASDWLCSAVAADAETAATALDAAGGSPLRAVAFLEQGLVEAHQGLERQLRGLLDQSQGLAKVVSDLQEVNPDTLWLWLSTRSAVALRASVTSGSRWPGPGCSPARDQLARLQQLADRNRQLARTGVRGDLLLRDWLIKWSDLTSAKG
jgi:DNA polymerase-3 subunit delta'